VVHELIEVANVLAKHAPLCTISRRVKTGFDDIVELTDNFVDR